MEVSYSQISLAHMFVRQEEGLRFDFLSNSTPTFRPNSTLVGWSRSLLCFPLSQQQEQEQPSPNFYQKERAYICGRCLEDVQ